MTSFIPYLLASLVDAGALQSAGVSPLGVDLLSVAARSQCSYSSWSGRETVTFKAKVTNMSTSVVLVSKALSSVAGWLSDPAAQTWRGFGGGTLGAPTAEFRYGRRLDARIQVLAPRESFDTYVTTTIEVSDVGDPASESMYPFLASVRSGRPYRVKLHIDLFPHTPARSPEAYDAGTLWSPWGDLVVGQISSGAVDLTVLTNPSAPRCGGPRHRER